MDAEQSNLKILLGNTTFRDFRDAADESSDRRPEPLRGVDGACGGKGRRMGRGDAVELCVGGEGWGEWEITITSEQPFFGKKN